jgi:hypothetical protein
MVPIGRLPEEPGALVNPAAWEGFLRLWFGVDVVLVTSRVLALRRPLFAVRGLPWVRDLPGRRLPGRHAG